MVDRLTGEPIHGSRIVFTGVGSYIAEVIDGRFSLEMPAGQYSVSVDGPTHVPHQTEIVYVDGSNELRFTVLRWGATPFGATYDETFHRAFHQIARVSSQGLTGIRRWDSTPEVYLVEATVPTEQFDLIRTVLEELAATELRDLFCDPGASISISVGPEPRSGLDNVIVVRPNWDVTSTGTAGRGAIRSGAVQIQVFLPRDKRLLMKNELKGVLLHELYHVAFGYHLCGGNLGPNPFGFSPHNCPYPESAMANLGRRLDIPLSPQDRLAACIVYSKDTHIGNRFPDINERYAAQ